MRGSKHKGSTSAIGKQSWHTLSCLPKSNRVESIQAAKRRRAQIFKLSWVLIVLIFSIAGTIWGIFALKNREGAILITTPSKPIEQIIFRTDGVLPNSWLSSVIKIRRNTNMMEVDIHDIKRQLEAQKQVKFAEVEREFPSTLKISVKEQLPIMRMKIKGLNKETVLRIISKDGTIYKGIGYLEKTLNKLPYLKPYQRHKGGFEPLLGIDKVSELLELARRTQPNFYSTWEEVSLQNYSGNPDMPGEVIEVRAKNVPRIIFGMNIDFALQLDRSKVILEYIQESNNLKIARMDLSLEDSAAVQFEDG